jgi:hypothetical protein
MLGFSLLQQRALAWSSWAGIWEQSKYIAANQWVGGVVQLTDLEHAFLSTEVIDVHTPITATESTEEHQRVHMLYVT